MKNSMKKNSFLFAFVVFNIMLLSGIAFASVPDADFDGVPDVDDKCPDSNTNIVDQFGCDCIQKGCVPDNNSCTDNCAVVNGLAACNVPNNNQCQNGFCQAGKCVQLPEKNISYPKLSMSKTGLYQGDNFTSHVTDAQPNSEILVYLMDANTKEWVYKGLVIGTADSYGVWFQEYDTKNWTPREYIAYISAAGLESNRIGFSVKGSAGLNYYAPFTSSEDQSKRTSDSVADRFTIEHGDIVMVSGASLAASALSASTENIGPQNTLIIVASIGGREPPANVRSASDLVFGTSFGTVNDFYIKNSFGQTSLVGRAIGPYSISSSACETDDILNEAIRIADPDVNYSDYSRIILLVPGTPCLQFGGWSTIGKILINTQDGLIRASVSWDFYLDLYSVGHELGHNFGLEHANSMECLTCPSVEYDDPYSIMGNRNTNPKHLNAPHKEEAGWLRNTLTTTQGEYLLKPLETNAPSGSLQQIKLPRTSSGFYTLEFRQPLDYDSGAPSKAYTGVFIHLYGHQYGWSDLINFDSDYSPLLQVGNSYRNDDGYEIILKSVSSNGALVSISRRGPPPNSPPVISSCNLPSSAGVGAIVTANYSISDPDGDLFTAAVDWGESIISFDWGGSINSFGGESLSASHVYSAPGIYNVTVKATDSKGAAASRSCGSIKVTSTTRNPPSLSMNPTSLRLGDNLNIHVSSEMPNSAVYLNVIDMNGNVIYDMFPWGTTKADGTFDLTISGSETSSWPQNIFNVLVVIDGQASNQVTLTLASQNPNLQMNPPSIRPGENVEIRVTNAPANSEVYLSAIDLNGNRIYNLYPIGFTQSDGTLSLRLTDTSSLSQNTLRVSVIVSAFTSNEFRFEILNPGSQQAPSPSSDNQPINQDTDINQVEPVNPKLYVSPSSIAPGTSFQIFVTEAAPNSVVYLTVIDAGGNAYYEQYPLGNSQSDGSFAVKVTDTSLWTKNSYRGKVTVDGKNSNEAEFSVLG